MLNNYIKIAIRNLLKNKGFSFINIFGLAIGIACTLLISSYVRFEYSYEDVHVNSENIYRLSLELYQRGELIDTDVETYQLIGRELKDQMPEVIDYVRLMPIDKSAISANGKSNYETGVYLADPSVFSIFSYRILHGSPADVFNEPLKAAISEKLAIKYFGRSDVVGETIQVNGPNNPLEIVGVIADSPQNTHLKLELLISHPTIHIYWNKYSDYLWNICSEYTYLKMDERASLIDFNKKLKRYSLDKEEIENELIVAEPIRDIHLHSNKGYEPEVNGSAQTVSFMIIIAVFIITIAWVNYINLSTARALNRAKEVGIRKVIGSSKSKLVLQFLMESFLINLLAGLIGLTMVQLFLPTFSILTGQELSLNVFNDVFIGWLLIFLVAIGTILSGVYPAFILSSFQPVKVLKGKFANSSSGYMMRKGLVIFQFLSTVVLIAVSLAVYFQIDYLKNQELGIDIDNSIVLTSSNLIDSDSTSTIKLNALANELMSYDIVSSIAQADAMPGADLNELSSNSGVVRVNAPKSESGYNYYITEIDENFIKTMSVELLAGRNFVSNEKRSRVLINEKAVQKLGFESTEKAIGKYLNGGIEIIGVVKNYYQRSPKESFIPMIFEYTNSGDFLIVRLNNRDTHAAIESIKEAWSKTYSDAVFEYYFLDDRYNHQYKNEQILSSAILLFTFLSILIAILGLFGLSTFTILQRNKELGVRKVLGASVYSLMVLLSKDFLKLVFFAGLLALPVAYYCISTWLTNFSNRIQLDWWIFVIPIIVIMCVALITILGQVVRSAVVSPVERLRGE